MQANSVGPLSDLRCRRFLLESDSGTQQTQPVTFKMQFIFLTTVN